MNEYTIRCTKEQIKIALELGVTIELSNCADNVFKSWDGFTYLIPTAEQMLGFLRSKGIKFHFDDDTSYWRINNNSKLIGYGWCEQKELAAIDAALDYLKTHQTT